MASAAERSLSIFSFNKLPKGFLIALIAVIVFEAFNVYFDTFFYYPDKSLDALTINIKNDIALSDEYNFDIFILGDSHTHFGIKPQIVEQQTGLSCFNFSLYSPQTLFGSYLIFKNYIEAHITKPKYVLIGHEPFSAFSAVTTPIFRLADLEKGNMLPIIQEYGIIQGFKFLIPSMKHQGRLKEFLKNPLRFKMPSADQLDSIVRQIYNNKGFNPKIKTAPVDTRRKLEEADSFFKNNDLDKFTITPFAKKYFLKILELAKENNVTPVYYVPALPPYMYFRLIKYNYMKEHDRFIDSLKSDYGNLVMINSQKALDDDDYYLDIYHLSKQ